MLDINKLATAFFREMLADPKRGEPGRAYLAKRGVGDAITEKFQLGYAPADWHALADYLKAKRVDLELAVKLGLVAQPAARRRLLRPLSRSPGVPGDRAGRRDRRVLGARDRHAAAGARRQRAAEVHQLAPRARSTRRASCCSGSRRRARRCSKNGRAVLVEGNFDVITLHQAGFTEVVAPLGTALTLEQVGTLKRLTDRVVLLYDGDSAGYKATMHALQICVEAEVEVLVASRPGNARSGGAGPLADGVDPDSLVAGGGAEQLREAIDRAQGGIEFFCFEVWGKARANADARDAGARGCGAARRESRQPDQA